MMVLQGASSINSIKRGDLDDCAVTARGTVTGSYYSGFYLHDSTGSIRVEWNRGAPKVDTAVVVRGHVSCDCIGIRSIIASSVNAALLF